MFCRPLSSKKRFIPHRVLSEDITFTLYEKAARINADEWKNVTGDSTIFLHPSYLALLERAEHTRLTGRYVIVYRNKKACGVIYYQIVDFKAGVFGDMLASEVDSIRSRRMNIFEKYVDANREEVLMRLFTCGNNIVSGNYGYRFAGMNAATAHDILLSITEVVAKEEKLRGTISAVLIKDFERPLTPAVLFEEEKYTPFQVEPNLVVDIPENVADVEAYVTLFSKKYRNRAKSIFRKLSAIEVRELDAAAVEQYESAIYALYETVFLKAKFRLVKLPRDYFTMVKKLCGDGFIVKGYFLDGRLVAFLSALPHEAEACEAHYIGFDYALNATHDLYQNILYEMIGIAIRHKRKRVNLGRTAAEIKSTVGARAADLTCYIKPQNAISRIIQKPFINFLKPAEWTPRNPFREEGSDRENKTETDGGQK